MTEEIQFDIPKKENGQVIIDSEPPKKESSKFTVNFMNEKVVDDLISRQTKKSEATSEKPDYTDLTVDQLKEKIKKEEASKSNSMTVSDFADIAKFLISMYDSLLSMICRAIAGDNTEAPYTLNKSKKDMLQEQLTMILCKYQQKFKIEFLFLMTLCIVSATPVMAARSMRKTKSKLKKDGMDVVSKEENKDVPKKQSESSDTKIEEKKSEEPAIQTAVVIESKPTVRKPAITRRRGNPKQGVNISE